VGWVLWSPPQLIAANLESGFSIDLAVVFVVQVDDRFARIMIHRQSAKGSCSWNMLKLKSIVGNKSRQVVMLLKETGFGTERGKALSGNRSYLQGLRLDRYSIILCTISLLPQPGRY
jgi:hypothetical protein